MLRDYRWRLEGEQQVAEDLSLNDAHFIISNVCYNPTTRVVRNEVTFKEGATGVFEHCRTYEFTLPSESDESVSAENIIAFVNTFFPDAIQIEP